MSVCHTSRLLDYERLSSMCFLVVRHSQHDRRMRLEDKTLSLWPLAIKLYTLIYYVILYTTVRGVRIDLQYNYLTSTDRRHAFIIKTKLL